LHSILYLYFLFKSFLFLIYDFFFFFLLLNKLLQLLFQILRLVLIFYATILHYEYSITLVKVVYLMSYQNYRLFSSLLQNHFLVNLLGHF